MKKTYVTTMPNHIGAFLKASRCFASLGVNITRVSYNKAVDTHTLFIDAEGTREQLERADEMLTEIGYLRSPANEKSVLLLEFRLPDVPGAVTAVLELIDEFQFNISYISSQENGGEDQRFKMGLFVEDPQRVAEFMARAEQLCPVRPIDYNRADKVYDNSIFYQSFVATIARHMNVTEEKREELLVNTNLAMQLLDERGLSPYRTFDSISRFAELLGQSRGDCFRPRITRHAITEETELVLIEPPCGSNTAILCHGGERLFIDSGYACYQAEMLTILRRLFPDFDQARKRILITHADVDHCGLLPLFDQIIASEKSAACLRLEARGEDGFREQNAMHKPYIRICKVLTGYGTVDTERITVPWTDPGELKEPLQQIGFFDFGDLHFEVYEGKGGHLAGEIVLIDYAHHIAFTGDVYVNLKGMTAEQAKYNQYAPILMTSVDTDPALCAQERSAVMQRLGAGQWRIFGAHGHVKDYELKVM